MQEKLETPSLLPTLQAGKTKETFGQMINVADAVKALQDPSEVYRKLSEDASKGKIRCFCGNMKWLRNTMMNFLVD